MDGLGSGYRAVVFGGRGGIGAALVAALQGDPACARVLAPSRSAGDFDLTDEDTIKHLAETIATELGAVELVIDATGALTIDGHGPEKTIRAIDPQAMARQFAINAIGPALLLKHVAPLMSADRKAIFASLSAKVGSIGDNKLGGWISYRASKAALNQILRTAAIEIARTHRQAVVVALHPGTVDTAMTAGFGKSAEKSRPAQAAAAMLSVLDGLTPADSGSFRAYDGSVLPW